MERMKHNERKRHNTAESLDPDKVGFEKILRQFLFILKKNIHCDPSTEPIFQDKEVQKGCLDTFCFAGN